MLRNLTVYLSGFTFFVCNLYFLANTSFATDDSVNEQYYGITSIKSGIVKLDNDEKEITKELKKDEVSAEEKETKSKMNVYFVDVMVMNGSNLLTSQFLRNVQFAVWVQKRQVVVTF